MVNVSLFFSLFTNLFANSVQREKILNINLPMVYTIQKKCELEKFFNSREFINFLYSLIQLLPHNVHRDEGNANQHINHTAWISVKFNLMRGFSLFSVSHSLIRPWTYTLYTLKLFNADRDRSYTPKMPL